MADSTFLKALKAIIQGPAQALQATTSLTDAQVVASVVQGLGPAIFSEQVADAGATTDRVARVFYAPRACRVLTLGIVVDSTATANGTNYKTLDVKKFANGEAIGSALATQMTTASVDLTARTLRSFTLTNGYIDLVAGDILVVDIAHAAGGVQLAKFAVVGTTQVL